MNASSDQSVFDGVAGKFRAGNLAGARADCEHFLATVNDSKRQSPAHFWLGAIEAKSGAQEIAAERFELGLAISRRDPFWLLQAGLTHFHLGNQTRAEQLYRDALRLEPRYALVHYNLGVLLQQKADLTGARRAFEGALVHQPQFAEAHTNLANTLVALGDADGAESHYLQALSIDPQLAFAHHGLGLHHLRRQQYEAAIGCFKIAVTHNPAYLDAWLDLAECHHLIGQDDLAATCVRQVLTLKPDHPTAQFKRAQFSGSQPDSAPHSMIERLYAGMADTFDEHLTQRLGYRIPSLLIEELKPWISDDKLRDGRLLNVLDLGCGTGLFGAAVRQHAAVLVGVDLSSAMLAKARQRDVYDKLIESDLQSFLLSNVQNASSFNLIVATDVLIYMGNLDSLFLQTAASLSSSGRFAFSVESPGGLFDDYRLEASGRFAHSVLYIARLAEAAGFDIAKKIATVVRTESAKPVHGFAFILQKR